MEGGHTDRGEEQSGEHVASEAYNAYQLLKHCTEADASRSGVACQFTQFAGDLPRNQLFAHCNGHPTEMKNGGRGKILTAIPARPASTERRNSHPADDHNFLPDAPDNYLKFRQLPSGAKLTFSTLGSGPKSAETLAG